MSTHNIGFMKKNAKLSLNYHQISSNTHLISSACRDPDENATECSILSWSIMLLIKFHQ